MRLLAWILLSATALAQPQAKIVGPTASAAGEMVVLSSTGSTGDNLKWIKPDGLQTLQVGCTVLDSQVVFATSKPGIYKFILIAADKQAAIDWVEHSVSVGVPLPPPPVPNPIPTPNPTPAPEKWTQLQSISKAQADIVNDLMTRPRLKATINNAIADIEAKCLAQRCPTLEAAKEMVRVSIENVLLTRVGAAALTDWSTWRKLNQAELDRKTLVDLKDYVAAAKAIAAGL